MTENNTLLALHEPYGEHPWCGTAALSAVTRLSTDTIAGVLADLRRSGPISTVKPHELVAAGRRLSLAFEPWLDLRDGLEDAPQLADLGEQWITPGLWVAWVEGVGDDGVAHIIAIQMIDRPFSDPDVLAVDNLQREPVPVADFPTYAHSRVMLMWRIRANTQGDYS